MKNKIEYNFLVFDENDIDKLSEKILIKIYTPLTPNAKSVIKKKNLTTNNNHLKFNYEIKETINKNIIFHYNLCRNNLIEQKLTNSELTHSTNILYVMISTYFYMESLIIDEGPWLLNDGDKFLKINNKEDVTHILFDRIFNKTYEMYNFKCVSFINSLLINLYNRIALSLSNKNKVILSSSNFKIKDIFNKKNFSTIYFQRLEKKIFVKILFNLIKIFLKRKEITLFCYSKKLSLYKNKLYISFKGNLIDSKSITIINSQLNKHLNFINFLHKYFNKIINSDFKLFLSHELCWFENIVIANICNKKRINVHLSSHGSHAITKKKIDDFSVNLRADGMLFSDLANINIVQSKKAYDYMLSRKPKLKILKNKPIIWGVAKYLNEELPKNNSKNFVILHASTCKKFGGRHWIYENSFEYIENINFLIKKLSNYQNVKLIIRFRENIDNKFELTKNLLIKSKNVEFKLEGNFYEDVMRSNLIVSFSSTVLEESLYLKKPVALFGNDHYRHINLPEGTKNNIMKSVYSLNRNNFDDNIKEIISKHNNNLTKNEIQNYCFTEADSNEYQNFIENFLNEKSNTF